MRHGKKIGFAALIMAIAFVALAHAQSPRPAFDVASIKSSKSQFTTLATPTGGRFSASAVTLRSLLQFAYRTKGTPGRLLNSQLVGAPAWIEIDRFDVEAKADGSGQTATQEQMELMLQSLLKDRFRLKVHWEIREVPIYNLVAKDGSKVKVSADQAPPEPDGAPPSPAPPTPPRGTMRVFGKPSPSSTSILLTMSATAVPMSTMLNLFASYVDRPVIDKTNLKGLYDLRLEFVPDVLPGASPIRAGRQAAPPLPSDPAGPSIFTALQEQLGLKLESGKGPVDVLVIDSVSKPSEN